MAKNSIDAYGASGKGNVLSFDPDKLHLVIDETSPLYDKRVHLPINEAMVKNIMYQGVNTPITVAKNPETGAVEVVVGRQRVKNAREANRRLQEQGRPVITVPGVTSKFLKNGANLTDTMIAENEQRAADTPIGRAEKMQQLRGLGRDDEAIATVFGCTKATIASSLALLDCTKATRDAVDSGKIGIGHALKLAKLPPEEQRSKVAELVEAGEGAKPHERAKKQRAIVQGTSTTTPPKMRTRKEIVAKRDEQPEGTLRDWLSWVLGER